jgi:hypothetical protein
VHLVPGGDLIDHDTEAESECVCGPALEAFKRDDGSIRWVHIHHSLDGREARIR